MFIKKIEINNFRLFNSENSFILDNINIPNQSQDGSGLTVFVGENGCGKTAILDAISLTLIEYKSDNIQINDFNSLDCGIKINAYSS